MDDYLNFDGLALFFEKLKKKIIEPIREDISKKLNTSKVVDNLLTTTPGYVLDARQGKVLQDQVDVINSSITPISFFDQLIYNHDGIALNYATKIGHLVFLSGTVLKRMPVKIQFPTGTILSPLLMFLPQNYDAWDNKDYQCFTNFSITGNEITFDTSQLPYSYTAFNFIMCV